MPSPSRLGHPAGGGQDRPGRRAPCQVLMMMVIPSPVDPARGFRPSPTSTQATNERSSRRHRGPRFPNRVLPDKIRRDGPHPRCLRRRSERQRPCYPLACERAISRGECVTVRLSTFLITDQRPFFTKLSTALRSSDADNQVRTTSTRRANRFSVHKGIYPPLLIPLPSGLLYRFHRRTLFPRFRTCGRHRR